MKLDFKNNKKLSISLIIVIMILSIVGGTFAFFSWEVNETEKTIISLKTGSGNYEIEGGNVEKTGMYPTAYCNGEAALVGEIATVTAINESDSSDMEASLKIRASLSVNQGTMNDAKKSMLKWALVDTSTGATCGTTPYKGTFSGVTTNTDIDTGASFITAAGTTVVKTYQIYVWLDINYEHKNSGNNITDPMQNLFISVRFSPNSQLVQLPGNDGDSTTEPNVPVLDTGMIPVKIANNGEVTTLYATDSSWYDYDNKEWANAVLVKSSGTQTRDYYKSNTGVTIPEEDILAYYVWIPRYKYKIWTLTASSAGNEQSIDIVFESDSDSITQGSQIGDYITHPAFIWDGTTVPGIWVGKFETTGDATTPTIKHNLSSLRNQNVSAQFTTSLKFSGGIQSGNVVSFSGNNNYGLGYTTDSHMMKNTEWGAVAYLAYSRYGINGKVRINNNQYYTTGCGSSIENGSSTTQCQIQYGSGVESYPQSTSGNITGVFDMSGGAYEYVMGVYSDSSGNPVSGYNSNFNSGFNGMLGTGTNYTLGNSFPENNYYDLYLSSQFTGNYWTNITFCNLESCGGHALFETSGWNSGYSTFVVIDGPWFLRGGTYSDAASAGIFGIYYDMGSANFFNSWRSVVIVGVA